MRVQSKLSTAGRLLLGVIVLGAAAAHPYELRAESAQPTIPRGVAMTSWQDNGNGGRYVLQVIQGQPPKGSKTVIGTVKSDTDCDIDAQGLSHCHNIIELANGQTITVIDTHNMHRYRCLGEGDRLSLTRVKGAWLMGTLSAK